ncbi:TPA: transcriptional regulator [Patescibacteria group bacterium]|nr:transcriptional regulator [Patescibacteria group bacterium]HCU47979.1 transcriptional regulator [Patescibacteria group bacterium]
MRELEKLLKPLANRRRLALLKYLKTHRNATVGQLADGIKLSFKATSKHLAVLRVADIVEAEQKGVVVDYSLASTLPSITKSIINII